MTTRVITAAVVVVLVGGLVMVARMEAQDARYADLRPDEQPLELHLYQSQPPAKLCVSQVVYLPMNPLSTGQPASIKAWLCTGPPEKGKR